MIELPCQLKPVLSCFEPRNFYDGPQPLCITLLRKIYGGPRRWSQIYYAKVDSWDQPVSELHLPQHFVLKLRVVSELCSYEDWDPFGPDHPGPDAEEAQRERAERETQAYQSLIGCPVTPRWFGTYQFILPSGEVSAGTLLEYIDGEPLSRRYIPNENNKIRPFAERMVAAAEAVDHFHSRGVYHGHICEANTMVLKNPQERFPIRIVGFGYSDLYEGEGWTEKDVKLSLDSDTSSLMKLLVGYFGLTPESAFPLLRAIPREGAIVKFLEAWDVRASYEEQLEAGVAQYMARGATDEARIRRRLVKYVR